MASRHSTGVTYSLARNSCLSTSMRLECAICGRGAEFPRASARRCLTFPHGVYSAHRFSSRSFSSPTRCTGFADSPPVDGKLPRQLLYHGELPTRLDSLHGQCDPIFPLYWDEQHSISLNSAIYLRIYTAGPSTLQESSSSDSELSSC